MVGLHLKKVHIRKTSLKIDSRSTLLATNRIGINSDAILHFPEIKYFMFVYNVNNWKKTQL